MFVFLSHIAPQTNHEDILEFVAPALRSRLKHLSQQGVLEEIKIIGLHDKATGLDEYHGLLIITPDPVAEKVIKNLNNQPLLGQRIEVREYRIRSAYNDPRRKSLYKSMVLKERRKSSRRRACLEVIKNTSFRPDIDYMYEKMQPYIK